ncbi:ATP-binding cassette domain-containing protein [Microbacteriaceae bacterium VKM Ac-2855]|nr:ATP-binding cassette domain-containing protein [Microbacteriaceae bacterium VKM Ac-2855]
MSVAALRAVTVRFGSSTVLEDVSFEIAPGERILLIGPSGSGKSTVLNALTGVVPFSVHAEFSGSAVVGGVADAPVVERTRTLGFVAQDPSAAVVLPTVEQDIALVLENHGVDPAEIDCRIDEALAAAGCLALRHRLTDALSGGEAQRVALAAALAPRPALLVLDEPTAMLDPAGVSTVRDALDALPASVAVLLVEHRLDELGPLPARTIAVRDGRVLADGPTAQVLAEHGDALREAGCWLPGERLPVPGVAVDPSGAAGLGAGGRGAAGLGAAGLGAAGLGAPGLGAAGLGAAGLSAVGLAAPALVAVGLAVHPSPPRGRRASRRAPGPTPTLEAIDLTLRPGELVALLGPNGAGKSTLLRTLAGLLPPLAGSVSGGRVGMVFQDPAHQFVANTVREEVGYGLPRASLLVDPALERHRLTHLVERSPHRLSGGEKRRLSLAAMLAHERSVLLADEPTFGLDRRDALTTMEALRAAASGGAAVLFSSHDRALVEAYAGRVIAVGDGRIVFDGPTAEYFAAVPA